jgi:hypothetical protein
MGLIKRKYFKNADTKYAARGGSEPLKRGFPEEAVTYISLIFNNLWGVRCGTLHHKA